MNRRLKKALPLLGALVFLMVGAALAVPSIKVNVKGIGAGGPTVVTVPGGVTQANVSWVLATNLDFVKGVKVTFDQTVPAGTTIIVKVYSSSDNPSDPNTAPSVVATHLLNSDLAARTPVEIDFGSPIAIGNSLDQVAVVLIES